MVEAETVPAVGVNETDDAYPDNAAVETSKPVGAVTTKFALKSVPETEIV
jgi:hypothetical protein